MRGKKRRTSSQRLLMLTIVSLSLLPMTAYADSYTSVTTTSRVTLPIASGGSADAKAERGSKPEPQAKVTKEEAVAVVRTLFPQLAEAEASRVQLGNDHSYPSAYLNVWDIQWQVATANGSYGFNSLVDSMTGELLQTHLSLPYEDDNQAFYPPKVTEQEALEAAKAFIFKASSGLTEADIKYVKQPEFTEGSLFGPVSYSFYFSTMVSGLPSPGESINVTVNGNGEVTGYYRNKAAQEYPSAEPALTLEEASDSYLPKLELSLMYMPNYDPYGRGEREWFLGWTSSHVGELSVDAQTGDYLNPYGEKIDFEAVEYKAVPGSAAAFSPVKGTGEGGLLTEEEAAAIVEPWLPVVKERERSWSRLDTYWNDKNRKVWQINWVEKTPSEPYGGLQSSAVIDAATGQVLDMRANKYVPPQYRTSGESDEDTVEAITEQELQKTAFELLNRLYPGAAEELKWVTPELYSAGEDKEKQRVFRFQRFIGDIPVGGDTTSITLDLGGHLTAYNTSRASDIAEKAQALEAKLNREEARARFLERMALQLQYQSYGGFYTETGYVEPNVKLVYGLAPKDGAS